MISEARALGAMRAWRSGVGALEPWFRATPFAAAHHYRGRRLRALSVAREPASVERLLRSLPSPSRQAIWIFDGPGEAQGRTYRVGVLLFTAPTTDANVPVFREALRATGYVEGRNLVLEFRYADGKPERLKGLAEELAQHRPDLIYAFGGDVVPFAQAATRSIPIVAMMSLDPVRAGIVPSLSHPGGTSPASPSFSPSWRASGSSSSVR